MSRPVPGHGRRSRRLVLGAVAVLLLVCAVLVVSASLRAVRAAGDLEQARAGLTDASRSQTDLDAVRIEVARARVLVASAEAQLDDPTVAVVARVPILGRSLRAEQAVVRATGAALAGAEEAVTAAPALRTAGGVDLQAVLALGRRLAPLAERASAELATLRRTPTGWTPPAVREAVEDAEAALGPVVAGLDRGAAGAEVVGGLLGASGPRTVLVGLQNNAELRGTGGFVSSLALGTAEGGRLQMQPFQDVFRVNDPAERARPVPAPPAFVEDYGVFLADTTLWTEWTMTPDVPDAAAVTAAVAAEQLGVRPDVVLLLDVPALVAITKVADQDVELPDGSTLSPDELSRALFVDTYEVAGREVADQSARRAALRGAAGRTATELLGSDVAPLELARELGRLGRGRHLAVWSAREAEQVQLERLGLAGSADPRGTDLALLSVNNLGADKLDFYVDRSVRVEAVVGQDTVDVVQRVTLANRAPEGLVPYVAGEQTPGDLEERLELSLAPGAQVQSVLRDGQPAPGAIRPGPERTRVHTFVSLPRGATTQVELRYTVPITDGRYLLRLVPQALAEDADLVVSVTAADGEQLDSVAGAELGSDGSATRAGAWSETELLSVRLDQGTVWERTREAFARFWREPVRLG